MSEDRRVLGKITGDDVWRELIIPIMIDGVIVNRYVEQLVNKCDNPDELVALIKILEKIGSSDLSIGEILEKWEGEQ